MIDKNASDLHISAGATPAFRIDGSIMKIRGKLLGAEDTRDLIYSILTERQKKVFEEENELDFTLGIRDSVRLRVNVFVQRGGISAVFRKIQSEIPDLASIGYNKYIQKIVDKPHGLILVTGATGSGKSTSLAAFIDTINKKYKKHIITIEDPVEYAHKHKNCIVNQREVGTDTKSFTGALRQVLREDPDVIMIGEIRDATTAEAALRAAETGHLVFSTLHTNGVISAINRLIQMFDRSAHDYIRSVLSLSLEAVISQALCQNKSGKGRTMAYEYLSMTPAIRNLIREDKLHQVYGQMQVGQEKFGMVTMNQQLLYWLQKGKISIEEAFVHSPNIDELHKMLEPLMNNKRGAA